jgi:hypothetical protein
MEAQRRPAQQQRRPAVPTARHEFGVDLGAAYVKPDGTDGGIEIGTPLELRLGLVTANKLMWEPRLALGLSTVGGATTYAFEPGVNVLYPLAPGTHRRGMFITGGAALALMDFGQSGTQLSMNAGVGWRKPWGNAAWRYTLGFEYLFENADLGLGSEIRIGGTIGVSLWH